MNLGEAMHSTHNSRYYFCNFFKGKNEAITKKSRWGLSLRRLDVLDPGAAHSPAALGQRTAQMCFHL